jgi:hypothetical protein
MAVVVEVKAKGLESRATETGGSGSVLFSRGKTHWRFFYLLKSEFFSYVTLFQSN